jgi:hypothetical protein
VTRPAPDLLVLVEPDDDLGEDLDTAARRLVAGGLHRCRHLMAALRREGFPRRRGTLHRAARLALLAAGIPVRPGSPGRR